MSHNLSISKAAFAASLMKPDPVSLGRDDIATFHSALEEVLHFCSSREIQRCREWLVANVLFSTGRVLALAKYLLVLSQMLGSSIESNSESFGGPQTAKPPEIRKQLHILYLLHDVLHHARFHATIPHEHKILATNLEPCLRALVSALLQLKGEDQVTARLYELLDIWAARSHLEPSIIVELRNSARGGGYVNSGAFPPPAEADERKAAPFIMPSLHGDSSTPFYDLPAGNIIPHIVPNSTKPLDPQMIRPIQFTAGLADRDLTSAVEDFLDDIGLLNEEYRQKDEGVRIIVDPLGEQVMTHRNEGRLVRKYNYYGWSHDLCHRIRSGGDLEGIGSLSSSGSVTSRRQTAYERSLTPDDYPMLDENHGLSYADHRSPSCSYSPPPPSGHRQSQDVARGRSPPADPRRSRAPRLLRSGSPPKEAASLLDAQYLRSPQRPQLDNIPPRPTNYQGPWPPPPPPTTSSDMQSFAA